MIQKIRKLENIENTNKTKIIERMPFVYALLFIYDKRYAAMY